jgi:hypothetical protein
MEAAGLREGKLVGQIWWAEVLCVCNSQLLANVAEIIKKWRTRMNLKPYRSVIGLLLAVTILSSEATAQATYSAKVPDNVLTPDSVETETLGKLEFFDGMPHPDTVKKLYNHLDLTRGVTAFLDGMKISS